MEPKPSVELHNIRHPTDEQLQHSYIFSNYYNLQSVHFELHLISSQGHVIIDAISSQKYEFNFLPASWRINMSQSARKKSFSRYKDNFPFLKQKQALLVNSRWGYFRSSITMGTVTIQTRK